MKRFWWAGVALLLISNAAVLAHVYLNRQGEPQAQMRLTERELPLPYRYRQENSGLTLRLDWRMRYREQEGQDRYYREALFSLSEPERQALGLAVEPPDQKRLHRAGHRQGYVALEFDGSAYRQALVMERQRLQSAQREAEAHPEQKEHQHRLEQQQRNYQQVQHGSRLYLVDAGLSREALYERYADGKRYLILEAVVKPVYRERQGGWQLLVQRLQVPTLFVPLPYRSVLTQLQDRRSVEQPPRYAVEIRWGSRGEPWLTGLSQLENPERL